MINLTDALNTISRDNDWDDILIGSKILEIWSHLIIEKFGDVATVRKFENGELFLKARSSTWKSEINIRADELISQVNSELGRNCVRKLVVKS